MSQIESVKWTHILSIAVYPDAFLFKEYAEFTNFKSIVEKLVRATRQARDIYRSVAVLREVTEVLYKSSNKIVVKDVLENIEYLQSDNDMILKLPRLNVCSFSFRIYSAKYSAESITM